MTIKHHIILSATITVALIAVIACQQKTQAPQTKEQPKAVTEQTTKVEEAAKKAQEAAAKAEVEAKEAAVKAKEAEAKANEEAKNIGNKIKSATEEIKGEINEVKDNNKAQEELGSVNIFVNSDFSDGFKSWNKDKDVNIVQEDGENCVELNGVANNLTRIWQPISTTSGHVYRLSFKLKAAQNGALCIFRDNDKHEEFYFFPGESKQWKTFKKTFTSKKNGDYMIFLSCNNAGKFYYSDISLIDVTSK